MKPAILRPATILPPPLIYFANLAAAWALNRSIPLHMDSGPMGSGIGWSLVGLGVVGFAWAMSAIWPQRTTVNPYKAASTLVTSGPFRFSRNPIYVSDWLVYAGVMFLLQTWWALWLAPLVWVLMRYQVIQHEEAHLQAKFGAAYTAYCESVRRWL